MQAGVRDYNAGRYDMAQGEFQSVVQNYPMDDLAGTAQFYLGEIAYQQKDYATAIKAYNAVLEGFSGNAKAPAAQLHKGYALLAENKKDEGIHELRSLIQRHPQTPEAHAARSKLNGMGVRIAARDEALRNSASGSQPSGRDFSNPNKSPAMSGAFYCAKSARISSAPAQSPLEPDRLEQRPTEAAPIAAAFATLLWWRTSSP